jgi:hypothetical protein
MAEARSVAETLRVYHQLAAEPRRTRRRAVTRNGALVGA